MLPQYVSFSFRPSYVRGFTRPSMTCSKKLNDLTGGLDHFHPYRFRRTEHLSSDQREDLTFALGFAEANSSPLSEHYRQQDPQP